MAQPFAKLDVHVWMPGEKVTQVVWKEFSRSGSVRKDPHMALDAARVLLHVAAQLLKLRQNKPGVVKERLTRWREGNPLAGPLQQFGSHAFFQIFDPGACCGYRHMKPLGATRQAIRLSNTCDETKINQIEMHGHVACSE